MKSVKRALIEGYGNSFDTTDKERVFLFIPGVTVNNEFALQMVQLPSKETLLYDEAALK